MKLVPEKVMAGRQRELDNIARHKVKIDTLLQRPGVRLDNGVREMAR